MNDCDDILDENLDADHPETNGALVGSAAESSSAASGTSAVAASKRDGNAWSRARLEWSVAAVAALGYCAALAAILLGLDGLESERAAIPRIVRGAVMVTALAIAYGIAFFSRRKSSGILSRFFFAIGALELLLALALCSPDAPKNLADENFWSDLAESAANASGIWTACVFLLATLLPSRALQFIAALATIAWTSSSDGAFDPYGATLVCVAGEYWAWRHSSRAIATLYAALFAWTFASEPTLWRDAASTAPAVVAAALLAFWYGASYKSAACRGCALVACGLGLGAAATPGYWERALGADYIASSGVYVPQALSIAATVCFILFCSHMIFSGASRSAPRFALGVSLATVWTIVAAVMATRKFGVGFGALTLACAAVGFLLFLAAEKKLASSVLARRRVANEPRATTDGAEDDPEFQDPIDAETVETRDAPGGAVETVWFALASRTWRKYHKELLLGVLALHLLVVLGISL